MYSFFSKKMFCRATSVNDTIRDIYMVGPNESAVKRSTRGLQCVDAVRNGISRGDTEWKRSKGGYRKIRFYMLGDLVRSCSGK